MAIRKNQNRTRIDASDENGLCQIATVAEFLAVSRRTVERLVRDGVLESVKVGRARRISRQSLLQYAGRAPRQPAQDTDALRSLIADVVREVLRQQSSQR